MLLNGDPPRARSPDFAPKIQEAPTPESVIAIPRFSSATIGQARAVDRCIDLKFNTAEKMVNAWWMPGGKVAFYTGIMLAREAR